MHFTKKKLVSNIFLLIFILLFVQVFTTFFGENSIFIASFAVTAVLMFTSIDMQLPRTMAVCLFPILFPAAVLFPYLINLVHNILFGSLIIILSVGFFLFFLGPSLPYQSYVPFLYLYAININNKMDNPTMMLIASFIGGLATSAVYFMNHKKGEPAEFTKTVETLACSFYKQLPFAIKITVGILLAYIIGFEIGFVKTSWIVLTVVSLTEVDLSYTHRKLWQRVIATVIGITAYALFLEFICPKFPMIVPIFLIFISYIYTFIDEYFIKMIFVTFNALNSAVATNHLPSHAMIESRMIFIFIGAAVAILIGAFFHLGHKQYQKRMATGNSEVMTNNWKDK